MSSAESPDRRPRVLIIDDDMSVRMAMARYFKRRAWDATEAVDAESAMQMLAPNEGAEFDVVICDLRMPRVSGIDLYRWMVRERPDTVSRLAFSTGDAEGRDVAEFLEEASRPVLPKPFELSRLARIVDEILTPARAA